MVFKIYIYRFVHFINFFMVSEHALTVTQVTQTKDTGSYSEKYSKKLDVSYPSLINATGNELVRAVSELPDVA